MKYYLKVFGCQMNQSDTERIATILEKYKIKKASSIDEAGLIIFVTCGVRQSAEDRVYGQINDLHKKFPKKKIALTGCLAHRKDVQKKLKEKVSLFFSITDFNSLISLLNTLIPKKTKSKSHHFPCDRINNNATCFDNNSNSRYSREGNYLKIAPKYKSPYTAYVPIMTGCNNFCSYCVVPASRGREYSRPAEDILYEIKSLVKKDCKEIILLGQNVNSYKGSYKNREINFPKLLRLIENIPAKRSEAPYQTAKGGFGARGHFWLTFLTSHPKDMSDELIKTIAKSEKICEYISLPVQSGDNEILQKMNRRYTVAHYKNLIKKIRKAFRRELNPRQLTRVELPLLPPALSTDIIVGFPGETKKQFENTAKLMKEIKFDMAYISQYSPRPQTTAWKLKDNVPKKEKERREKILTKILEKTALTNNKKYIGKIVEVLIDKILSSKLSLRESRNFPKSAEGKSLALEQNQYKYLAHTRTQKKVVFCSNKKIPVGTFQKIKITKSKAFGLEGEIIR